MPFEDRQLSLARPPPPPAARAQPTALSPRPDDLGGNVSAVAVSPLAPAASKRKLFNPRARKNSGICNFNRRSSSGGAAAEEAAVEKARQERRERRAALGLKRASAEAPLPPMGAERDGPEPIPLRAPLVA